MADNIAKRAVERTSRALLGKVFPGFGKVPGKAAEAVFSAVVRTGSALVTDIAASMDGDATSRKGRQEKVSGWLARYDFATPVRDHLWDEGVALVGRDTVVAVDSGDISKEFGGRGMEGMEMGCDVFGTGRGIGEGMARAPCVRATLRSPTRRAEAEVRWRAGFFPAGDAHLPVLVVSSAFGERTLYLYALNFAGPDAAPDELRRAAVLAANAYFCRWGVEVLFQDVKQCLAAEDARVRTFRRLENLLALCTLAYSYFAHVLPRCGEESRRLLKTMRDSLGEIAEGFRPFVANVRELLRLERARFISGRPRKRRPPDPAAFLPGFGP